MKTLSAAERFQRNILSAAVAKGYITQEHARECIILQETTEKDTSLIDICKQKGYLTSEQVGTLMSSRQSIQISPLETGNKTESPQTENAVAESPQAKNGGSESAKSESTVPENAIPEAVQEPVKPAPKKQTQPLFSAISDLPGKRISIPMPNPKIPTLPSPLPRVKVPPVIPPQTQGNYTIQSTSPQEEVEDDYAKGIVIKPQAGEEVAELRIRLQEKEKLLESERKHHEFLNKKLEMLEKKWEAHQKEIAQKDAEISSAKSELNNQVQRNELMQIEVQEYKTMLEDSLAKFDQEKKKSKVLINLIEENGRETMRAEEAKLAAEEELRRQMLVWESKIEANNKQLDQLRTRLDESQKEFDEKEKDWQSKMSSVNLGQDQKILELQKILEDKDRAFEKLKDETQFFQDQIEMYKELNQEGVELSEKKIEELSLKVQEQHRERVELVEKFRNENSDLEKELKKRKDELEEEKNRLLELFQKEKTSLKETYFDEKNQIEEKFLKEKAEIEAKALGYEERCKNLEVKLTKFQESVGAWDSILDEERNKIKELEAKLQATEKEKTKISKELEIVEEDLKRFRDIYVEGEISSGAILPGTNGECYEIISTLGKGGMGTTYEARRRSDSLKIALKVMSPRALSDMKEVMRFVQEARTIIAFNHPNLIKGYDLHQDREIIYYTMEYLEGESVEQMLKERGFIEQYEATRIILQIAGALTHLEELFLLHRDIKPGNIIVANNGTSKLVDFGIVKMSNRDCSLTTQGTILGTPYYLSPEQAIGEPMDIRSDIYSLGATFYHMVVGEVPFSGNDPIEVINKRLGQPVKPGRVNPSLNPSLCGIIEKMMHKRAQKRQPTAQALVSELEQVLNNQNQINKG